MEDTQDTLASLGGMTRSELFKSFNLSTNSWRNIFWLVFNGKFSSDSLIKLEEAERRMDEEDYASEKQRMLNVHKNRIRLVLIIH